MQGNTSNTSVFRKLAHIGGIFFALLLIDDIALANPTGANVVAGSATVLTNPTDANHLIINQSTDKAIINWQDFNIGTNEHTQFIQPSSTSFTLNRVTGGNESQILGRLSANGRIMLINPAGIMFGAHSRVDVAALVASTADISNADFMAGNYRFNQAPGYQGNVVNHGLINVADTGFAVLVSPAVANHGIINARLGTVILASGVKHTLDLYGDGLINFTVDEGAADASVTNAGAVYAEGGSVLMTASAAANTVESVVNLEGYVEAASVEHRGDRIVLNGTEHRAPEIKTYANNRIELQDDYRFHGDFDSYWHMYSEGDIDFNQKNVYATGLGGQSLLLNSNGGTIWLNPADGIYTNGGRLYVTSPDGVTYQSGTFDLTGTGGPQNSLVYNDPVVLTSDTTLTDPTSIIFNNTIDGDGLGPWALNITVNAGGGTLEFNGDIGAANPLASLFARTFGGADNVTLNLSQINTIGDTTIFGNNMNIAQSLTINAANIQLGSVNNNFIGSVGGNHDLTFNTTGGGLTRLDNLDGPFGNLTTNADGTTQISTVGFFFGAADNTANFTGDVVFNNPVLIDDESFTVFSRLQANNVTFNSTVNLEPTFGANYNYEILATGTVNFNDTVGATNPMNRLTVIAPTININTPTITANDIVTLNGGAVLGSNLLITAGALTNSSTINSDGAARTLTINSSGATTLSTLGNTAALSSLTTDAAGTTTISGPITTTGAQTFNDAVTLTASGVHTSTGSGNIAFLGGITGGSNTLTVNTGGLTDLTGGATGLTSVTTDAGGSTSIAGTLSTSGAQIFNDAVTLTGPTTLTSTGGGNINLVGGITGGGNTLAVNTSGITNLAAGATGLASLTTNAGGSTFITSTFTTTGDQTFNDTLVLAGNTILNSTGGGAVSVAAVTGASNSLTINTTGATNFNGVLSNLIALVTDAGGTNTFNIGSVTANTITLAGNNTFTVDTALNGANITLSDGALSGNFRLDINQTTLATLLNLTGSMKSIHINGTGLLVLNNVVLDTTDNTMIVDSPVELVGTNTISGSGGGNVVFNSTVDSGGSPGSLAVNTAGSTQFNGLIGSSNPVQSIQTDAPGRVEVNTPAVRTISFQIYNEELVSNQPSIEFFTVSRGSSDVVTFGNGQLGATNLDIQAGRFTTTGLVALNTFIRGEQGITGTGINITGNLTLAGSNGADLFGTVQGAGGAQAAINADALGGGRFLINSCVVGSGVCFSPLGNSSLAGQIITNNIDEEDEEDVQAAESYDTSILQMQAEDDRSLYPSNYHNYLSNNEEDPNAATNQNSQPGATQTSSGSGNLDEEEEEDVPGAQDSDVDIRRESI